MDGAVDVKRVVAWASNETTILLRWRIHLVYHFKGLLVALGVWVVRTSAWVFALIVGSWGASVVTLSLKVVVEILKDLIADDLVVRSLAGGSDRGGIAIERSTLLVSLLHFHMSVMSNVNVLLHGTDRSPSYSYRVQIIWNRRLLERLRLNHRTLSLRDMLLLVRNNLRVSVVPFSVLFDPLNAWIVLKFDTLHPIECGLLKFGAILGFKLNRLVSSIYRIMLLVRRFPQFFIRFSMALQYLVGLLHLHLIIVSNDNLLFELHLLRVWFIIRIITEPLSCRNLILSVRTLNLILLAYREEIFRVVFYSLVSLFAHVFALGLDYIRADIWGANSLTRSWAISRQRPLFWWHWVLLWVNQIASFEPFMNFNLPLTLELLAEFLDPQLRLAAADYCWLWCNLRADFTACLSRPLLAPNILKSLVDFPFDTLIFNITTNIKHSQIVLLKIRQGLEAFVFLDPLLLLFRNNLLELI